jgi:ribosomal protein L15
MNGQKKRSSVNIPQGFEGGQTPMHRRLPKTGFKNMYVPHICADFAKGRANPCVYTCLARNAARSVAPPDARFHNSLPYLPNRDDTAGRSL